MAPFQSAMTSIINFEDYVDDTADSLLNDDINPYTNNLKNLSTKRLRIQHSELNEFQPGAVVKLKLTNFVTYALTEFHLSPSLNMIIGPNGSGKSTFVCAICLGLAGKPEYIGRSKKVEEYIKNGTDEGVIEITLKNSSVLSHSDFNMINADDDVVHVKRVLSMEKKKSKYYINNKVVTEEVVKNMVRVLNIQLDNLCQFLSQERVEEFARLKPDTLLNETIRSIEAGLLQKLSELKSLQAEGNELQIDLGAKENKLKELSSSRAALESQAHALELYEEKARELDIHQKLLNYTYLKEHKEKIRGLKDKRNALRNEVKTMESEMKPFNLLGVRLSKDENNCKSDIDDLSRRRYAAKTSFNSSTENIQKISKYLSECESKVNFLTTRNKSLKEDIKVNEEKIKALEEERNKVVLPDPEKIREVDENLSTASAKRLKLNDDIADLKEKKAKILFIRQAKEADMRKKQSNLSSNDNLNLLDGLQKKNNSTVFSKLKNAILYLRSVKDAKGKVFEPALLSVSAVDETFAAYLQSCIDFHTSTALTMIDKHAYAKFSDYLVEKFNVNIRELSDQPVKPRMTREELRSFGFEGYLVDFIKGDENVIKMLCQQQKIHMIPVTRHPLDKRHLEALKKVDRNGRILFPKFIEGSYIHNINQSEYGRKQIYSKSIRIKMHTDFYKASSMGRSDIDAINLSIKKLHEEVVKLDENLKSLSTDIAKKEKEIVESRHVTDHLKTQRYELGRSSRLLQQYDVKIGRYRQKVNDNSEKLRVDIRDSIKEANNKLQDARESERKALLRLHPITIQMQEFDIEMATENMYLLELRTKIDSISQMCRSMEEARSLKKEEFIDVSEEYKKMKNTDEFIKCSNAIENFPEEEKDVLNEIAVKYNQENQFSSIHIESIINRLSSELSMINNDTSVIDILRKTNEDISILEKTLPHLRAKLASNAQTILEIRNSLEPRLDDIVKQISKKFSHLFAYVGSAGQVELKKPDSFNDWCIEIKVKFRDNSELQQLNPHVQSGGERAVSTVLYMIALQQFTSSPFRVVDEINQGMDQTNERIVHRIMVENACAENTSQYFLITPKLLTNLFYHERMRIHCVFAGSWIPDPATDPQRTHFGETTSYIL
ncbi:Smc5 [Kluyveromyces lactis]|nr:Smc5 [Kluyveromyces lactis]